MKGNNVFVLKCRVHRWLNMAFCCVSGVVRKGMGIGTCGPCKPKNRHQRWHHSIDRIPFNQHIFSSYITSIIPKYVDRCTIKILWGAGVMTQFVPLSFHKQLLPLPLSPNKNFGRRLDFAWTLFCMNFCSY